MCSEPGKLVIDSHVSDDLCREESQMGPNDTTTEKLRFVLRQLTLRTSELPLAILSLLQCVLYQPGAVSITTLGTVQL
jgi:hypothetical protein